jgi:hypothetical protein
MNSYLIYSGFLDKNTAFVVLLKMRSIPKIVKDVVYSRQKGKCACCMDSGAEYHHILPYSIENISKATNIVLLCNYHHNLFHLGDIETIESVFEYGYYLNYLELPENKIIEQIAFECIEKIRS